MSYLLAIDAGTGSCRALLFSEKGEQVAASQREWTHHEPPDAPGGQDFDVTGNWLLIAACVRDALRAADATGADVAAVAATSMRDCHTAIDHGYFTGPTTGLERVDLSIVPIVRYADALTTTWAMVRRRRVAGFRWPRQPRNSRFR